MVFNLMRFFETLIADPASAIRIFGKAQCRSASG
jgi:hypothetical protein